MRSAGWLRLAAVAVLLCAGRARAAETMKRAASGAIESRVEELLARMTLDEKVGQMTQADRQFLKDEADITRYALGSLLSGGGSAPAENTPAAWADMVDRYQGLALKSRLGIPLLYGIDAVHGHNNVSPAVIFPHNIGLGATRDPALLEDIGRITAAEVAGTGMHWAFAPCLAVARDERWGRSYESYGEAPELVAELGAALIRGLHGPALARRGGVLACAKHFVGDGGTVNGIDQGDARMDEESLRRIHLPGYLAALRAGARTVMVSYSSWNGNKLHGHAALLGKVLKGELGFTGFVVSDWKAVDQLPGASYKDNVATAINAGIDMVMVPENYRDFISSLKELVLEGRVPITRIDDATRRILRVKHEAGLFDKPAADRKLTADIGSPAHRLVSRRAVRQSLVLLKNAGRTLPLAKRLRKIVLAGPYADDLGAQCGGWTISWQGSTGPVTTGTTILEGIRDAVGSGTELVLSPNGSLAAGADAAIVVIGERPYAEFHGDRRELSLDAEQVAAVRRVKAAGIPTVVVLLSGRPLILTPILDHSDALVAAWLPGSEGGGVADVLFGEFPPTGKLPLSWPRDMAQVPINVGEEPYDPLFPYGFGLTY